MILPYNICCRLYTLVYIILNTDISFALRDVRVQIPHAVRKSERAILKCLYDLEGDSLYSVKWYKGRREFYSFTPKENPAMKVFQFAGVKVDRSSSNESQLVLENVNAATSGKYSCEVSADAPSFHTLIGAGELEVVVPGKDPVITGIRSRYKVGDIVRGNCTSSHSRPAANITWTINGYETNPAHIRHFKPHKDPRELETVISAIHFVVTPQHFIYGKLKIRCTAFIHDVYWKSAEKSIEETRLSKSGASNVVHKFSEDYFDLDEDNVVDRSDTYMTHIKGDVSSLNASGGSALHKCSCFWPRLTTLSLLLYIMHSCMFSFLQQLLTQTTKNKTEKYKQSTENCQTANTSANKRNCINIFKAKVTTTAIKEKQDHLQTITSLATEVAAICYGNNSTKEYWPKEKYLHEYFQVKFCNKKHLQQQKLQIADENKLEFQSKHTNIATHKPNYSYSRQLKQERMQQSQLHLRSQMQLLYNKTSFKLECNLATTTTTQVTNITPANVIDVALLLNVPQYIYYKICYKNYKLYAQKCTAPTNSCSNCLNIANCLNTCTTGNSILNDLLSTATIQIATIRQKQQQQ